MDGWGDQGVNYNQEFTRTKSYIYRKPPHGGNSNWQQSVPSWEKRFCASVGSVPWKKLLETKKIIHLYDNIIKWNDSAGKEAFQIAKNNFYANIHGLPRNNPLPDPDIYIDKIDWDSEVDPHLILELDSDSVVPDSDSKDEQEHEQVVIFGSSFPPSYQTFSPYGWGDSDDDKKKDVGGVVDNNESWCGWNENVEEVKGDEDHWSWNVYNDNNNNKNCFYGDVSNNNEMKDGNNINMSRYKTSRFSRNDNKRSQGRRNAGDGRRLGGSQPWKAAAYGCAPPGGGAHRWSVKKPVS